MKNLKYFKTDYTGNAVAIRYDNIDTDQILPKQYMKSVEKRGFGNFLFDSWRFSDNNFEFKTADQRVKKTDFPLNQEKFRDASILVSGNNFGCGSSREHAPWAIADYGFRVIIAESFADIFYFNCINSFILPIELDKKEIDYICAKVESKETYELNVNLQRQEVFDNKDFNSNFKIEPFYKENLLNGYDMIDMTMRHEKNICVYEDSIK